MSDTSDFKSDPAVFLKDKVIMVPEELDGAVGQKPGTYKFFDDYHPDTAVGTLTAVEKKD